MQAQSATHAVQPLLVEAEPAEEAEEVTLGVGHFARFFSAGRAAI